jgi:hypothetical protein
MGSTWSKRPPSNRSRTVSRHNAVVVQIILPRRSHELIIEAFIAGLPSFEAGIVRILQTPQAA